VTRGSAAHTEYIVVVPL